MPPPNAVYLPPELKVAVLAGLDKRDLKSLRLVSKKWNALATRPLFDRLYVSCRAKDLEVFKNITRHPVISTCVRELVYDRSIFIKNMDYEEYFDKFYTELDWTLRDWMSDTPFDSADAQVNKYFQDCIENTVRFSKLYKAHKEDTFLVEGYRKYRDHSAFEHQFFEHGLLFDHLCMGLNGLNALRSVVLSHKMWTYDPYENKYFGTPSPKCFHGPLSGSPVCRSWNPFHLRPCDWEKVPDVDDGRSRMCAQFHMLTGALRATNKMTTSLQVNDDSMQGCLPQQALIRSKMSGWEFWHLMTAYTGLRCLDIDITTNQSDRRDALTVLPELLAQTRGLRRLSLHFYKDLAPSREVREHHRYDEIFPTFGFWPEMTDLSLTGLAIGGWDLMMLVNVRARLRRLELSEIDLLDGTWEGAIEGMRRRPLLTELRMYSDFTHRGGAILRPRAPRGVSTDQGFLIHIEQYVVNGGRHPCLAPECDSDIAFRWYMDMMPERDFNDLRQLIREVDDPEAEEELIRYRK